MADDKWYGWIPTNLGKIKLEFIDQDHLKQQFKNIQIFKQINKLHISNVDLSYISDSPWFTKLSFLQKEHSSSLDLTIAQEIENFYGNMKITYENSIEFYVDFLVYANGIAEFVLKQIKSIDKIGYAPLLSDIKQILYVVLKSIVHGDSHHHQKIDTAIKITHNRFDEEKILDDMILYLKTIEKNIKHIKTESIRLKQNVLIEETQGYMSYIKTFVVLFEQKGLARLEKKQKIALNIKDSLQATINKREKKYQSKEHIKTVLLTIAALFIATNILINSFYGTKEELASFVDDLSRLELFGYSLGFWILAYVGFMWKSFKSGLFYRCYGCYKFLKNIKILLMLVVKIVLVVILGMLGTGLIIYGIVS